MLRLAGADHGEDPDARTQDRGSERQFLIAGAAAEEGDQQENA